MPDGSAHHAEAPTDAARVPNETGDERNRNRRLIEVTKDIDFNDFDASPRVFPPNESNNEKMPTNESNNYNALSSPFSPSSLIEYRAASYQQHGSRSLNIHTLDSEENFPDSALERIPYGVNGERKIMCHRLCVVCTGDLVCTQCAYGHVYTKGKCKLNCEAENCSECKWYMPKACHVCNDGYKLIKGICVISHTFAVAIITSASLLVIFLVIVFLCCCKMDPGEITRINLPTYLEPVPVVKHGGQQRANKKPTKALRIAGVDGGSGPLPPRFSDSNRSQLSTEKSSSIETLVGSPSRMSVQN